MQHKRAYFWGLLNQIGPSLVSLVSTMCLTRILTPSDYGIIGVLTVFFTVANVLIDSGLGGSLINQTSISKNDCNTIATFNLIVGIIIYTVLYLVAPLIEQFYSIPGLSKVTRITSLMFLIHPIGLVPNALIIRNLELKKSFIISFISASTSAGIAIIFAFYGLGVYALVLNYICNSLFKVLLSCILCHYKPKIGFSKESFARLFPFGLYTTLTSVVDSIYESSLYVLSGKYFDIPTTGYLKQAKNAEDIAITSVTGTISSVLFPVLARKKESIIDFVNEADEIYRKTIILIVPLLVTICIFSKEIIVLLFGSQWEQAGNFLSLLMIAGIVSLLETLNRSFIKSSGNADKLFHITIIKRLIGISALIIIAIIRCEWILYAYIISTIIAFGLNMCVYSKIISKSVIILFLETLKLMMPSTAYFITILLVYKGFQHYIFISIASAVVVLFIYYKISMKYFGVSLSQLLSLLKINLK